MNSSEIYAIREWAPCTNIVERIPTRPPRFGISLFAAKDLNITCIDAVDNFFALGTDGGVIYWYNRETDELQRLDPETASAHISCLRIVDSVEYIVAAGDTSGKVHVFQIQKKIPADLESVVAKKEPIQRYTVRELHPARITCCEWSRNGMKLYSGDLLGVVVLTEFDYQKHISRSMQILSEAYEIVQLSVYRQYLLVCTLYRALICCYAQNRGIWNLWQVGRKDRKQLEDCGGIFLPRAFGPPVVICGRPGQRFWLSDLEGNVEKTLLFKDALEHGPNWEIPLLNPKQRHNMTTATTSEMFQVNANNNFRKLQLYTCQQMLLVTHDGSNVYILNLENLCVEAVARGFRAILDICVHDREIFVLEGGRTLVRLAAQPEKPNRSSRIIFNPRMPPLLPTSRYVVSSNAIEEPAELIVQDLNSSHLSGADKGLELPPIESLSLEIPIELAVESPRSNQARRLELFNKISKEDFDNIILHAHSTSAMDITDGELGKNKIQQKQRKKSQESKKSIAETCKIIENAMKSNGIVEIGKIALHQNSTECENTTIYNSLTEVCVEYIPKLFENIALGETEKPYPSNVTVAAPAAAEPKEFCDINAKIYTCENMCDGDSDKNLRHGEPVSDNLIENLTNLNATTTNMHTSTMKVSDKAIDELGSTRATNTTPQHERQFVQADKQQQQQQQQLSNNYDNIISFESPTATQSIHDADEIHTSSDWEFLNN